MDLHGEARVEYLGSGGFGMIDGGAFSPDKAVLCLEPGPVDSNPNRVGFTPIISIFSHECMNLSRLLIANRGEIAIRISRGAANLGIATVGVYSEDDASSLHCRMVDHAVSLKGSGTSAYLDGQQLIEIAATEGCDAVHPGYGFLAEDAEFSSACVGAGLRFVGPEAAILELFGNKARARAHAKQLGVPVLRGTDRNTSLEECVAFIESLDEGATAMIKAVAGGGGRGMRRVCAGDDLASAFARCQSEAEKAFGSPEVYVEECLDNARHIEVQVLGDARGNIVHLGTRECSLQRRRQKLIELAPATNLDAETREKILTAAMDIARSVRYSSLGTFEFLVDATSERVSAFIEANARLQVEHTVTEQVTGVDLVEAQLEIARGKTLEDLGLCRQFEPQGLAVELRVNAETMDVDGEVRPSSGTIERYEIPSGPGVRVDGSGYAGLTPNTAFDSLLAKLVVHSRDADLAVLSRRAALALREFRIEGVTTNIPLLGAILEHEHFRAGQVHTEWLSEQLPNLLRSAAQAATAVDKSGDEAKYAGARISGHDPLAVFDFGREQESQMSENLGPASAEQQFVHDGSVLVAPIQGTLLEILVEPGELVAAGTTLALMEAMKMEHEIKCDRGGQVRNIEIKVGDVVAQGSPLLYLDSADAEVSGETESEHADLDLIRPDLAEVLRERAHGLDENRPEAVAKRRERGQRTARENLADLCDEGTFVEYGSLVLAAQRRRRSMDWLRKNTPADGLVMGLGQVNGDLFDESKARCALVAYDYTVLAGTQGNKNHYKQDRLFHLAQRYALPVVIYTEGGGGRPGDSDTVGGIGMDVFTFTQWSRLSGLVPLVGVNSGYCFAGNTALLGCCDVIIATRNSTIGMGGPAMIEGGGLGIFSPREVGPMSVQVANGVVDILVEDEAEATQVAKQYLSYFQGPIKEWAAPDQRRMRHLVPENRKRIYQVRDVIDTLADEASVLEIRKDFGIGIVTALVRIEGHPMGLIANNPHHLAGAIDSDAADKAARFLQLCDAFDLPLISLMDCPGIMVGPEVEKSALVRHCCRLFNTGANLSVPIFGIILRKAYGLGAQAMCGGSSMVPLFVAAWPTAEFAGMNIEGSIKLAYRSDLAAVEDAEARRAKFDAMVADAYERAKAVNAASFFGVDDVIDPAESRAWILAGLRSLPPTTPRHGKKRPNIDTW